MANLDEAKAIGAKLSKSAATAAAAEYLAGSDASGTLTDMARGLAARQVRFESSKAMANVKADDVATGFWQRVKSEAHASLIASGMSEDDAADLMTNYHKSSSLRSMTRSFLPFMRWLAAEASLTNIGADTHLSVRHASLIMANRDKTTAAKVAKALRAAGGIRETESLIGIVGRKAGGSTKVTDNGSDTSTDTSTDTDTSTEAPTPTPKRSVSEAAEALAAEFDADELRSLAKALTAMAKRSDAAAAA